MNKPSLQAVPSPMGGPKMLPSPGPARPFRPREPAPQSVVRRNRRGQETALTTVPVRKPSPQDFVRVHPATRVPRELPDHGTQG